MIELTDVAARRSPFALTHASLRWGAGIHALVGAPHDGGPLLLSLIAGVAGPRSGRVRVLEGAPTDAAVRTQVAHLPLLPRLPDAMRVSNVLALAAAIRGAPPVAAATRLGVLGLESLADRYVETLSTAEARAVALAEAVSSPRVRVLLIEEPFVAVDPRAAAMLPAALRARASAGCAVVVATASVRDAHEIADDLLHMRNGTALGPPRSPGALSQASPDGARLRIQSNDPRALARLLAGQEGVEAVVRHEGAIVVRGRRAMDLARAAGRAVVDSGVEIVELRMKTPSLDEMRTGSAKGP